MASNPHHSDELDVDMLLDEGSEVDSVGTGSSPRPPFPALNIDPDTSDDEEGGGEIIGRGISAAHATPYKNATGSLAEPARSVTFDPASEDVDDPWLSRDDAVDRSAKASTLPNDIRPNELRKSSVKCAERSVKQTPVRKAATTADIPHGRSSPAPSRGPELVEELGTVFVAPKIHYARTCLLPTLAALETFKARDCYGLHANGRWVGIPAQGDYDFEKDLYTPTVTLLNKILDKFVRPSCPNGVERKVVESHAGRFQHKGEDKYTLPDIVVEARGPSFEKPANGSKLGYSNVAAIIEMKRERDMGKKDGAHLEQMSISARQVLAHQPNRHFIRCVLLSEETCRLFHFDRSGAEIFPSISFHTGAHSLQGDLYRFIRVIVTVCSPDEKVLGFDTSIQWDIVKGIKTNGRLYANGREYFLLKQNPVSVQVIKGRATTLWSVEDRVTKTRFIVKDSWAPEGRTGEHDLLRKAAGLIGVCQGVSFETGRGETKEYRSFFSIRSTGFCNRIASRIVMEEYGEQIQHFASKLQLVAGIRDAIAGHARLLGKAKILHRDISNKNILLGKLDTVGYRGILIDLNVAIDLDEDRQHTVKEARTGSRFFQSITILDSLHHLAAAGDPPPHDHTDDLESFFYVLCYIFLLFLPNKDLRSESDRGRMVICGWASEDPETASNAKSAIFEIRRPHGKVAIDAIRASWGETCATLFEKYLSWVGGIQEQKGRLLRQLPANESIPQGIFVPIIENAVDHYATVLGFFEDAIDALGGVTEGPWKVAFDAFPRPSANEDKRGRSPSEDPEDAENSSPQAAPRQSSPDSPRIPSRKKRTRGSKSG